MFNHRESVNCPDCGSADFITVHSDLTASFDIRLVNLRRCADCDAKYFPPTPRWVSSSAVLLGTVVVFVGIYFGELIPAYFESDERAARLGVCAFFYFLAAVGSGFVAKGFIQLVRSRKRFPPPQPEDAQIYFENAEEDRTNGVNPQP